MHCGLRHWAWPCLLTLALPALVGCQQSGQRGAPSAVPRGGQAESPQGRPLAPDPASERLARLDLMITQWDVTQAEGRRLQANTLAEDIRREVDLGWPQVVQAAQGQLGVREQYLGVSALGFASRPEATQLLVDMLSARDAQLMGNALIALRLRADPATPLEPLVDLSARNQTLPAKRYAPLALAAVLDARSRAGAAPTVELEQRALIGLASLVGDRESVVRMHTARALGALRGVDPTASLALLSADQDMRVRWAAAAALERSGSPNGFPHVVRLLHETPQDSKHIIRDMLVTYANRLRGQPLSSQEIDALGIGARAWTQWFNEWTSARGTPTPPALSTG